MAGHSKWAKVKHFKGAIDAKRAKIFSKLGREITIAAKIGGGDPDMNPRLRMVLLKCRTANMPKDNIERAIKKAQGGDAENYDEVRYEGYGPGGTAILLETLTDNRNRTVSEVRHLLSKFGGNLGATGCVSFLFEKKGLLTFERSGLDADALLEAALEAGAEDVLESESALDVATTPANFEKVRDELARRGFKAASAAISMQPTTTTRLDGKEAEAMLGLADALEDLDDVQNVYANFDISDEEMAKIA